MRESPARCGRLGRSATVLCYGDMLFRIFKMIATSGFEVSHSFIKHENLFSAGAPPRIPLGNLQRFPRHSIAGLS